MSSADRSREPSPEHELTLVDAATSTWLLTVEGIPQSTVCLTDPRRLEYDYVRHIARAIDASAAAGTPIRVAHLGAGALTLPRYVAATRPGSAQVVVESERALCEEVLAAVPLSAGSGIRLLWGDARAVADGSIPTTGWDAADVTVIDLWAGALVAAHVASLEFYELVRKRMAAGGLVAVNLLDGDDLDYTRGQAATLAQLFSHVTVIVEEETLRDGSFGNVVIVGSDRQVPFAAEVLRGSAEPHRVIDGGVLAEWIEGVDVFTDANAVDSPSLDDAS
jgi:spermidine synthase